MVPVAVGVAAAVGRAVGAGVGVCPGKLQEAKKIRRLKNRKYFGGFILVYKEDCVLRGIQEHINYIKQSKKYSWNLETLPWTGLPRTSYLELFLSQ